MKEPDAKKGHDGVGAPARAPAKGDSSGSDLRPDSPLGPDPNQTFIDDATLVDSSPGPVAARHSRDPSQHHHLHAGDLFAGRYEILGVLGEGGMGTVYKARDREVDHLVALKLIRPEMAEHPDILARFKQELLTARKVTHRNVIRIFDLAEGDGVKFITMEFVEGCDLRKLLKTKGKFAAEESVEIIRQVCFALDAAHAVAVIHRDLKPQNIMQDNHGRILVMDFGLARSLQSDGMTQTGALLGTFEYMSPEQALGKHLDARSDLFTLGLIFYELLTGKVPYKAESAMASLLLRNQERALPVAELDASIPQGLSDIVSKCLERDLVVRYQTAREILADLDAFQGKRPVSASVVSTPPATVVVTAGKPHVPWKWVAIGALAVAAAAGGWMGIGKFAAKPANKTVVGAPEVSLVILPFHNRSTDQTMDWIGPSVADLLSTDVGHSKAMRIVSVDEIRQILRDLRIPPNADLDDEMLKRIAGLSKANTLVSGQYAKFGNEIRIDANLLDLKHDRRAPLKVQAANEDAIPKTVDGLAELIRKNLAVSSDVLKELKASSFQPTSASMTALREFNHGVQLLREGRNIDATKSFQSVIKEDPQFALAYARLAEADLALGYDGQAEQYSRKAVDLGQNLAAPEKYLIDASHARVLKDYPKAIAAYENLAKAAPGDLDVQYVLGSLYEDTGAYQKARESFATVLKADPQSVETLWKAGGVEIMSDNPQGSLDYLNRGLTLAIQLGNDEKRALILQATGIAYKLMNKPEDALRSYQDALAIERRINLKRGEAASLNEMAQVYSMLGKPDAALASFRDTMRVYKEIGAKKEAGDTLIDLGNFYEDRGQHSQALQMFTESLQIQRDSGDETYQALCLNNIGDVYLTIGQYDNALTYLQQALQLREKLKVPGDIAQTTSNLALANTKLGQYEQALGQYLRALELYRSNGDKRGAAIDSSNMGSLFGRQGRYGAAVSSLEEAVKTFRELQDRGPAMGDVLNGYGGALADAGREEEAQKILDEALSLARNLKSQPLIAQSLNLQGNAAFYRGDSTSARTLYGQALQTATESKNREQALESKMGLAKAAIGLGHAREASESLKNLAHEADSLGSKYLSVESSLDLAESLVNTKDYARARQELEAALGRAEKLGLRGLLARNHYLLATTLRATGNGAEATGHYRTGQQLLEEIRKEAGAEKVLERADFKLIYAECTRWSQSSPK